MPSAFARKLKKNLEIVPGNNQNYVKLPFLIFLQKAHTQNVITPRHLCNISHVVTMVTKANNTGGWLSTRRKLKGWSNGRTDVINGLYITRVGGVSTVWLDTLKRSIFCTSALSKRPDILLLSLHREYRYYTAVVYKILIHFRLRGCVQFRIFGVIKMNERDNRTVNLNWH
jgi:hypothetical protein